MATVRPPNYKREVIAVAKPSQVRIEIFQEVATSSEPARVYIYDGNTLVNVVGAKVELKPGADGGRYPCVTLTEHKML